MAFDEGCFMRYLQKKRSASKRLASKWCHFHFLQKNNNYIIQQNFGQKKSWVSFNCRQCDQMARQANRWHHLPAYSRSKWGMSRGGGGCQIGGGGYSKHALTCLVGCRITPLGGYVIVCLVLTKEVYSINKQKIEDTFPSPAAAVHPLSQSLIISNARTANVSKSGKWERYARV